VTLVLACPLVARAQSGRSRFDATLQVTWATSGQFDTTRAGVGGRLAWHPLPLVGVEGELAVYPGDWPDGRVISRGQRELLGGVTVGPRLGGIRPFFKLRPGAVWVDEAPRPIACIAIFPPPLDCRLASGARLAALDYGAGVEVSAGRALLRIDAGDRMVKYPGPVFDLQRRVRDSAFWSHDRRVSVGLGVRF
jgi:hypothetical protein